MKVKNKLQWSAVLAFAGLIAGVAILNKVKGRKVMISRRAMNARDFAMQRRLNTLAKSKTTNGLFFDPRLRRRFDEASGTSRYSRDFLSGRTMGAHLHVA